MTTLVIIAAIWAIVAGSKKRKHKRRGGKPSAISRKEAVRQTERDAERRQREQERQQREQERQRKQRERDAEKERKQTAERQQAEADRLFLIEQLDSLFPLLWEADADLQKARDVVRADTAANKYGAVVPEKLANKHRAERDRLQKKVIQLESTIHAKETKLNKAMQIMSN